MLSLFLFRIWWRNVIPTSKDSWPENWHLIRLKNKKNQTSVYAEHAGIFAINVIVYQQLICMCPVIAIISTRVQGDGVSLIMTDWKVIHLCFHTLLFHRSMAFWNHGNSGKCPVTWLVGGGDMLLHVPAGLPLAPKVMSLMSWMTTRG